MKEITFTYKKDRFILDLEHGILHGANIEVVNMMNKDISSYLRDGYVGMHYEPFGTIKITDPYHDIHEFTACMVYSLYSHNFPKELEQYMPKRLEPWALEGFEEYM